MTKKELEGVQFAVEKHGTQKRDNGDPYWTHPFKVGAILMILDAPEEVVCAGFLHDVMEDTNASFEDIKKQFGENTAELVKELTKPNQIQSKDASLIKLVDRLDNLSDMKSVWPRKKQLWYLRKTRKLFNELCDIMEA
jgi:(p)ppGpp synthase/HD superfamily hydrolase